MRRKPKKTAFIAAALVVAAAAAAASFLLFPRRKPPAPPRLAASAYALVDMNSGETLYVYGQDQKLKLGSLTKLMPIYICFQEIENGGVSLDDTVTVSSNAAEKSGSVIGFGEGAEITLESLIFCSLIPSGNDAVTAISEFVCGDESEMLERMNQTAAELGMHDTRYTDCAGINSFDNRSTTGDLTILVCEMLRRFPQITEYTKIEEKTVNYSLDGEDYTVDLRSTNRLLGAMAGVYGLKTGTAQDAHNAIVLMRQGRRNLMAIVLDSPDDSARWSSARSLLEYGMDL